MTTETSNGTHSDACAGKVPFDSLALAKAVINRRSHGGAARKAYRCQHCNKWHIGGVDIVRRPGGRPGRRAER